MPEHTPAVGAAIEGELRLLDPAVCSSPVRGAQLAPDLVHLTFDTEDNGRRAHRSSLWRRTTEGWRLYFHQATPFSPAGG